MGFLTFNGGILLRPLRGMLALLTALPNPAK
jgi:hypothetical protein